MAKLVYAVVLLAALAVASGELFSKGMIQAT